MDIKFSILLYSKYSSNSTKIIEIINQYTAVFTNNFNFKLICIDNEKIRSQVLNSKNIKISKVPCILILYNDGGLEKYEGEDAFNWVESIINKLSPVQPVQQPQIQQPQIQPPQIQQPQIQPPQIQSVQQPSEVLQQEVNNRKQNQVKKQTKQVTKSNVTSIDDLDDLDIDDSLIDDENDMEFDIDIDNNIKNNNGEKKDKSALNIKRNDLMSMATMMQKSREEFVEKNEKRKNINPYL